MSFKLPSKCLCKQGTTNANIIIKEQKMSLATCTKFHTHKSIEFFSLRIEKFLSSSHGDITRVLRRERRLRTVLAKTKISREGFNGETMSLQ